MTVTSSTISATKIFNGATTAFGLGADFRFLAAADLLVHFITAAGARTLKTLGDDYTVTGDGEAGTAVVNVALAKQTGFATMLVERETEAKQDVEFVPGVGAPAASQERQHDRVIMLLQEAEAARETLAGRLIRFPVGVIVPELPTASSLVSKLFGTSALGAFEIIDRAAFKGDRGLKGTPGSGNLIGFSADDYLTPDDSSPAAIAANNAGMALLSADTDESGGGVIDFSPATYWVGGQTFQSGAITGYTGNPVNLFVADGLTKPLIIRGNGARIKCIGGLKFGTFDSAGVSQSPALPYAGTNRATPYKYMFDIRNCTAPVVIEDLELDGNIAAQIIGGEYGDTGWQIPMVGILLTDNEGGVLLKKVHAHHHGQDGLIVNGVAADEGAVFENIVAEDCSFDYNCRLGAALVGGRGISFTRTTMSWNGADQDALGDDLPIRSNPASGLDLEAEGGKVVRDVHLDACELVGNFANQIVADNTDCRRITLVDCTVIQTHANNYALWPNVPCFHVRGGLIAGTNVNCRGTVALPDEAFFAFGTTFTNDNAEGPAGTVGCVNHLLFESAGAMSRAVRCAFIHNRAGGSGASTIGFAESCTMRSLAGQMAFNAVFSGDTRFVALDTPGGSGGIYRSPGGMVPSTDAEGSALDSWSWRQAGVETIYPATVDRSTGQPLGVNTRGDAAVTLDPAASARLQLFTAALTADRAVALSTAGAVRGMRYRIARPAGGAFNLNVGTGPLKAMPAGSWAEVEYSGGAWVLTGYGAL